MVRSCPRLPARLWKNPARLDDDAVAQPAASPCRTYRYPVAAEQAARSACKIRARRNRPDGADQGRRRSHQGRAGAPAAGGAQARDRRRIPSPLLPQFLYRQLGEISIDTVGGEDAKGGEPGRRAAQPVALVNSRVRWSSPINVPDFQFIRAHSGLVPKVTIPGPCALHFRGGDGAVLAHAYMDLDEFWDDIVEAFRHELDALGAAGCRYVQIDETAFAKFGDPEVRQWLRARGDDWSALIDKYIAVTNRVLKNAPSDMAIGMHLCRGNRGGQWHSEGGYDEVADRLFHALK